MMMTPPMTPELARIALAFLARCELRGHEAAQFLSAARALEIIAVLTPPAEAAPPAPPPQQPRAPIVSQPPVQRRGQPSVPPQPQIQPPQQPQLSPPPFSTPGNMTDVGD
jgi:hypothetical protein